MYTVFPNCKISNRPTSCPSFFEILVILQIKKVEKLPDGTLKLETTNGIIDKVNTLIWAVGRSPQTQSLNLQAVVMYFL